MRAAPFTPFLIVLSLACNSQEASQKQADRKPDNQPQQQQQQQQPKDAAPPVKTEPKQEPVKKPTVTVRAGVLYHDYSDNEATADSKYLDRTVRMTGWIVEVKKEGGRYFACLSALASGQACIFCRIRPEAVKDFAGLDLQIRKGVVPEYTLEGVCKGKKAYRQVFTGYAVTFDDCVLIKGQKARQ